MAYNIEPIDRQWERMTPETNAVVHLVPGLASVNAAAWDAVANPPGTAFNPFVAYDFLRALEVSGSVGEGTGWTPLHLILPSANEHRTADPVASITGIRAAAPCYIKTDSQGEFVFDHGWADAYARGGGRYYPKVQIAVPFTPVPGPRFLVPPGADSNFLTETLAAAAIEFAEQQGFSSVHATFLSPGQQAIVAPLGYLKRTGQQFHWDNHGYATFDDFLTSLASRKRKMVRKERLDAVASDLTIERLSGDAITELHWDAMYAFYQDTGERKWGRPYLTRAFFSELGASMSKHCLLVMAKRDDTYVAGALNMIGGDCLYGRYWGALEHHAFLHFELCYYQAIDYAIEHRLARVEAGAQGEHKLARGYRPVETFSAHWIADPHLKAAISHFLGRERRAVLQVNADLAELGPYRKV